MGPTWLFFRSHNRFWSSLLIYPLTQGLLCQIKGNLQDDRRTFSWEQLSKCSSLFGKDFYLDSGVCIFIFSGILMLTASSSVRVCDNWSTEDSVLKIFEILPPFDRIMHSRSGSEAETIWPFFWKTLLPLMPSTKSVCHPFRGSCERLFSLALYIIEKDMQIRQQKLQELLWRPSGCGSDEYIPKNVQDFKRMERTMFALETRSKGKKRYLMSAYAEKRRPSQPLTR